MKKLGLLSLFFVICLILIGMGYASWTDQLKFKTIVRTGEFRVEFSDDTNMEDYIKDFGIQKNQGDDGTTYGNLYTTYNAIRINANSVMVEVENLYPGVGFRTNYWIENKGTIPAVFDNALVDFSGSEALQEKMGLYVITVIVLIIYDSNGSEISRIEYDWSNKEVSLSEFEIVINELLDGVRLEPNEKLHILVSQCLPIDVVNEDYVEGKNLTHVLSLYFKQHNVN